MENLNIEEVKDLRLPTEHTKFVRDTELTTSDDAVGFGRSRTTGTQTLGCVFMGKLGETIITTNFNLIRLVINDELMRRLTDYDPRDDGQDIPDILQAPLARLEWNGERILERAMTSFRLTLTNELMPQLLGKVSELLTSEQDRHSVQQLAQNLLQDYDVKLFGMNIGSLVFILEHPSVEDAERALNEKERQTELERVLVSILPNWVANSAEWTVASYTLSSDDGTGHFGFENPRYIPFTASLQLQEEASSEATAILHGIQDDVEVVSLAVEGDRVKKEASSHLQGRPDRTDVGLGASSTEERKVLGGLEAVPDLDSPTTLVQPSPVQVVQASPVPPSPVPPSSVPPSLVEPSPVPVQASLVQPSPVPLSLVPPSPVPPSSVPPSLVLVQASLVQPSPVPPSPVPPSLVEPSPVEPSLVESSLVESSLVESSPVEPSLVEPSLVESSPVQPSPAQAFSVPPSLVQPSAHREAFSRAFMGLAREGDSDALRDGTKALSTSRLPLTETTPLAAESVLDPEFPASLSATEGLVDQEAATVEKSSSIMRADTTTTTTTTIPLHDKPTASTTPDLLTPYWHPQGTRPKKSSFPLYNFPTAWTDKPTATLEPRTRSQDFQGKSPHLLILQYPPDTPEKLSSKFPTKRLRPRDVEEGSFLLGRGHDVDILLNDEHMPRKFVEIFCRVDEKGVPRWYVKNVSNRKPVVLKLMESKGKVVGFNEVEELHDGHKLQLDFLRFTVEIEEGDWGEFELELCVSDRLDHSDHSGSIGSFDSGMISD